MTRRPRPRALSPWQLKWLLNLFPPLLLSRIRMVEIAQDFRSCKVRVASSRLTRNLQGSTFGGTIFSAADPFYAVLLWQILAHRGRHVQVWLRGATIEYRKPAAGALTLDFRLSDEDIHLAVEQLDRDGRYAKKFRVEALDDQSTICAVAETEVYLRLAYSDQRDVSAF